MTIYMICWPLGKEHLRGQFLKSYDPEAYDGRGYAEFTDSLSEAMTFTSKIEAWDLWRTIPESRPKRPDGKDNRPLTAYSVLVDEVKDNAALNPRMDRRH